jgi:hypothetical protein
MIGANVGAVALNMREKGGAHERATEPENDP